MKYQNTKKRFIKSVPEPSYRDTVNGTFTREQIVAHMYAKNAQIILFNIDQVRVFLDIIENEGYLPPCSEASMPFDSVWLEFTEPVDTFVGETDGGISFADLAAVLLENRGTCILVYLIRSDNDIIGHFEIVTNNPVYPDECNLSDICNLDDYERFHSLVIACLTYINCENVYLEKQGEVPEAVNRKREAKGKSRLEPYYVCRIKGVQHDSHATGTGVKHGIRYDVRGHFRRLDTGKTIWVRPHQRGLQNELYIPKVYKVEKGSKPAFNGKEG